MSRNLSPDYWQSFREAYWHFFLNYILETKELRSTPAYPAVEVSAELAVDSLKELASLLEIKAGDIDEDDESTFPEKLAGIAKELSNRLKGSSMWSNDKQNISATTLANAWMVVWSTFGSFVFKKVPHLPRWLLVYQQLKVMCQQ